MDLFGLENLKNLGKLKRLDEMKNLQKLDELKHIDKMEHLQQLPQLQHMDQLQHIESLDKLQPLYQLQHLDKLSNLQELSKLQSLDVMKNLHHLEKLQHMDHLQQLHVMNRLGELQELSRLQNMQALKNLQVLNNLDEMRTLSKLPQLSNLQYMENLQQLNNLQQLEVMNRLRVLDRLLAFNFTSLLYLLSIFVPGLVFQETIALLLHGRLSLKRSLVLMTVYNVLNLLACVLFAFNALEQFSSQRTIYYLLWFGILILLPFLAGWLITMLAKVPQFKRLALFMAATPQQVANAWERFLTGAESYRLVITLNNEEKMMGIFRRDANAPKTNDPNDLYFTETSYYDPKTKEWKNLEQPVNTWVKGSEIRMIEMSTQT